MTQEMKYTPGPYEAWPVRNDRLKRWEVVCVNQDYCPGTGKTVLAERIRTEANARLFAAAPELLEALEAMMLYATDRADLDEDDYTPQGKAAFAKARAAFSKAVGSEIKPCTSPAVYCQMMGRAKRVKTGVPTIEVGFDKSGGGA